MKLSPATVLAGLGIFISMLVPSPVAAQEASSGFSQDLDFYLSPYAVAVPSGKTTADIRAMGIAGTNDHIYTWYDNGTVSEGRSADLDFYQGPQAFSPPIGKSPHHLVAAGIAGNNNIYFYWDDGTVSKGTSTDTDFYFAPQTVSFPSGLDAEDLRGIGIAGSNDHVYAWFGDGTVSEGTSQDLDAYAGPTGFSLPGDYGTEDLAGIGITGSNDRVYAWYHADSFGEGWSSLEPQVDTLALDFVNNNQLPGLTVAVSKSGRMVLNKGYGSADLAAGTPMEPHHRSRIGSVSKVITAMGVMHHAQEIDQVEGDQDFSFLTQPIYGPWGILNSADYPELTSDQLVGKSRYTPVVGTLIWKSNDWTYTYYDDGTFSAGSTSDLDSHSPAFPYTLPPGQDPQDIRGIAADNNAQVYTWYQDGSWSRGKLFDLDFYSYSNANLSSVDGVTLPPGQGFNNLLGVAMAGSNNRVYSWYEDGTRSTGIVTNLGLFSQNQPYTTAPGQRSYDLRSVAISHSDRVYAFYGNNTVSAGTSWDLDSVLGLYNTSLTSGVVAEPWHLWYGTMNLQHLMSHTAGFSRDADSYAAADMFNEPIKHLGFGKLHRYMLQTTPLLYAPADASLYSNEGMGLAGYVLEESSGLTYKQYIDSQILSPLGLQMGLLWEDPGFGDARTHRVTNSGPVPCDCTYPRHWGEQRGGLTSNAGDLVRLMLATDKNPNHPDILNAATVTKMETSPYLLTTLRALGWGRDSGGKLSHSGKISGGMSYIAKFPAGYTVDGVDLSNITVAVATNADGDGFSLSSLATEVAKAAGSAAIARSYDIY